jgi:hypothetical protein
MRLRPAGRRRGPPVAVYRTTNGARRPACSSPSPCPPARHRTLSCTPATASPGAARHCAFSPCPIRPADTWQPPPRRHRGGMRHTSGRATSTDGPHVRRRGTRGERPAAAGGRGPQTGVKPCAGRFRPAEDGRGTIASQARSFGRAAAGCAANRLFLSARPHHRARAVGVPRPGSQAGASHGLRTAVPRHKRGYRQKPQRHPAAWAGAPDAGRGQVTPVNTT